MCNKYHSISLKTHFLISAILNDMVNDGEGHQPAARLSFLPQSYSVGGENDMVGLVLRSLEFMDLAGKTGLPFYTVV